MACTLYSAMAYEAEDDDLDVEIYEELIEYSKIFEEHAWKVFLRGSLLSEFVFRILSFLLTVLANELFF